MAVPIVGIPDIDDAAADDMKDVTTAATIKKEEQYEPLLQENPQRFVLFPIKYHEVRVQLTSSTRPTLRVKWFRAQELHLIITNTSAYFG